jgi:hypothetical protein
MSLSRSRKSGNSSAKENVPKRMRSLIALQVLPCAAQIRLARGLLERRPIAHALQHEIVLNAVAAPSGYAAGG